METLTERKIIEVNINIKDTVDRYTQILSKSNEKDGRKIIIPRTLGFIMHNSIMMKEPFHDFNHEIFNSAPDFSDIIPFSEKEIGYIIMHSVIKLCKKNANEEQSSMFFTFVSELGTGYIEIFIDSKSFNICVTCCFAEPVLLDYDNLVLGYHIYSKAK